MKALFSLLAGIFSERSLLRWSVPRTVPIIDWWLPEWAPSTVNYNIFRFRQDVWSFVTVEILSKVAVARCSFRFLEWVKAWLTERITIVEMNEYTEWCRLYTGSLLLSTVQSPLLFVILIENLRGSFELSTLVQAYADDTELVSNACRRHGACQQCMPTTWSLTAANTDDMELVNSARRRHEACQQRP